MFDHIHNIAKVPSQECGRGCERPCTQHKSNTCTQILGSSVSARNLAAAWASNPKEFMIVRAYLQDVYASTAQFTPGEYDAYREGLNDFIKFMELCLEETKLANH